MSSQRAGGVKNLGLFHSCCWSSGRSSLVRPFLARLFANPVPPPPEAHLFKKTLFPLFLGTNVWQWKRNLKGLEFWAGVARE